MAKLQSVTQELRRRNKYILYGASFGIKTIAGHLASFKPETHQGPDSIPATTVFSRGQDQH